MKRRKTVGSFQDSLEFSLKESEPKTRGLSLGDTSRTNSGRKLSSISNTANKRPARRSSALLLDHRLSTKSKDVTPKSLNAKDRLFSNNSIDLSKPSASTPELHSYGLPVCDTLKKVFRNGLNSGSGIQCNGSNSRLFSSEKTRSRSVIEESPLCSNDGSYLEEVFLKNKDFDKERKGGSNKNNNGSTSGTASNINARGERLSSLSKSKTEEVVVLSSPVSYSFERKDVLNHTDDRSVVNDSIEEQVSEDRPKECPLKGVVAFIDVRSTNENRFEGVALELEKMGAAIVRRFSPEVTHVIFKNGKKSTINLIEKHDVHFVSVLWVDSCKQTWSRVDEESFPVAKTDTGSPLGLFRAKSKRLKSLQPKAFDEDLNHSGKLEGKRKKRNIAKDKNLELNLDLILCENTDKGDISKILQSPDSIVNSPLGNGSPFFRQVQKRWAEKRASLGASPSPMKFDLIEEETEEMQTATVKENIEKILDSSSPGNVVEGFEESRATGSSNDGAQCIEGHSETENVTKIAENRTQSHCSLNGNKAAEKGTSRNEIDSQKVASSGNKDIITNDKSNVVVEEAIVGSKSHGQKVENIGPKSIANERNSDVEKVTDGSGTTSRVVNNSASIAEGTNCGTETCQGKLLNEDYATVEKAICDKGLSDETMAAEEMKETKQKISCDTAKKENVANCNNKDNESGCSKVVKKKRKLLPKAHCMAPKSPAINEENPKENIPVACRKPVDRSQELRMTVKENNPSPSVKRKRQSPVDSRKRQKHNGGECNQPVKVNEDIVESRPLTLEADKDECQMQINCDKNIYDTESASETDPGYSEVDEKPVSGSSKKRTTSKSDKQSKKTRKSQKRSLVMTSLHFSEQKFIRTAVGRLGSFSLSENVNSSTTHVIAGNNRRTLNILNAVIQGAWILSPDWVCASYNQGKWLEEEEYELNKDFPVARANRLKKIESGESLAAQLLKDQAPFYVAETTSPPRDVILKLIRKCGGQSTSCTRKAEICIGKCTQQVENINEVEERWLLDCIMKSEVLDTKDYLIQGTNEES